jgi:hypothetical protein
MKRALLLFLFAACHRAPPAPPAWPGDLTEHWSRIALTRAGNLAVVELTGEQWRLAAGHHGDADPDTVDRLTLALTHPQVLAARPVPAAPLSALIWELQLTTTTGKTWNLSASRPSLTTPVVVRIAGVGEFTVAAVEMANQVPVPEEFLTPGLWTQAKNQARRFTLKRGPVTYSLVGALDEWHLADGGVSKRELDDFPGIIVGRQAIGHPSGSLKELGLDPPLAEAELCVASGECRTFLLGKVGDHRYAVGPDSEPLELRASDFDLLLNGP